MRILLAQPRGCCAGVDMAIESLERTLRLCPPPVYAFHQIVHNRRVIEHFLQVGVIFVDDMPAVPEGATVVFSAHGVSPQVRQAAAAKACQIIDATCPLVAKVHNEARSFARRNYSVILIGHPGHDEITGVLGEAPERITVVETVEDIEALTVPDPGRVAYITQTTWSVSDAQRLVNALKKRFPAIVGPSKDDICYATQNRQDAVQAAAMAADLVLVVGSGNSSNSRRLVEVAREAGTPSYLIEGPESIDRIWLAGVSTVALSAGASVPEELVGRTARWLSEEYGATIEEIVRRQEFVRFPLPEPLRASRHESLPSADSCA